MDLVAFLKSALDQDEQDARAAVESGLDRWAADPGDRHQIRLDDRPGAPRLGAVVAWTVAAAQVPHIARWDPARVLAEVAAKRAILELHQIEITEIRGPRFDEYSGRPLEREWEVNCAVCGWAGLDPATACATLRALVAPFASRAGFDPSWLD